jgi:Asp-tRNA(Asn)/Glu-tRNA(Gln) amidotransferase C subunit
VACDVGCRERGTLVETTPYALNYSDICTMSLERLPSMQDVVVRVLHKSPTETLAALTICFGLVYTGHHNNDIFLLLLLATMVHGRPFPNSTTMSTLVLHRLLLGQTCRWNPSLLGGEARSPTFCRTQPPLYHHQTVSHSSTTTTNDTSSKEGTTSTTTTTTTTTAPKSEYPHLPEPTWSVQQLQLKSLTLISEEELQKLSRRSLLLFSKTQLESSTLRQDLSNMMHMINQLQSFQNEKDTDQQGALLPLELSDVEIYDAVRGVTSAPLRSSDRVDGDEDDTQQQQQQQHQQVWDKLLRPKMIRKGGGHEFFSIVTSRDVTSTKNEK